MGGPAANLDERASRSPSDHGDISRPATGFTAVNGRASPTGAPKTKSEQQPARDPSEASKSRPLLPNNKSPTLAANKGPSSSSAANGPSGDGSHATGPGHRNSTSHILTRSPPPRAPPAASSPLQSGYPYSSNGTPTSKEPRSSLNGMPSPPKRKRSASEERSNINGPVFPGNAPPPSPGGHRMSVDSGAGHRRDSYGRPIYSPPRDSYPPPPSSETYPPPPPPPSETYSRPPPDGYAAPPQHNYPPPPQDHHSSSEIYSRPDRPAATRNDYDHPVDPSIAPASQPYYSDQHLADALQRENRNYDNAQAAAAAASRNSYGTPEEEDDQQGQYGDYGSAREGQGGMDMDRRKRKRVFSNRTKTGCMTCRRRKKKCDEQHPECNNCLRGGFVCEGYNARNTWQKPANTKAPLPIQSKNGYPQQTPGRNPYPPGRFEPQPAEYSGPPAQHYPSYDGGRPGPVPVDEGGDPAHNRSDSKSQPTWNKTSRPYPSNPPQASKYQEGEHRGSIYEMPPESTEAHSMPPPQQDTRNGSSQYPPAHNKTPPTHNVQAAAQAALTHPASGRPMSSNRRDESSERERMLKGLYYYPHSPALIADRENCIQAIWRFNNATNPSHGVSPEERIRLFRAILTLRPTPEPPLANGEPGPTMTSLPFGSVGERVTVEAPFHCDYGYNITIGDDVLIGADCRISDTCAVSIGARCIFSPNVKLICATYPIDPKRRAGSRGPALGRNIVIEEDCWIGANVTILAGVRVGKSSTVGAGSLLHQDVPRFTVVAGNPAKVSRGIYDGDS